MPKNISKKDAIRQYNEGNHIAHQNALRHPFLATIIQKRWLRSLLCAFSNHVELEKILQTAGSDYSVLCLLWERFM